MKKVIILCIVATILLSSMSAYADLTPLYPANVMACYMAWANYYGVSDLSDEMETKTIDDDTASMMCDMLITYSDRHTLKLNYAILLYRYPGYDDMDMDLRAVSLFSALEYGAPLMLSDEEASEAEQIALDIFRQLRKTINEKSNLIDAHEFVKFYIGNSVIYSVYKGTDGKMGIIVDV